MGKFGETYRKLDPKSIHGDFMSDLLSSSATSLPLGAAA